MEANERFTREAAASLREEIAKAGGNEVCAAGALDGNGLVASIRVLARGHKAAVAALVSRLEPGDVFIHNHPSGGLEPSDADVSVASLAGNAGHGAYIVDNEVAEVYVLAEPVQPDELKLLDLDEIGAVLGPGGKLSRVIPGFESRESQVALARDIARAFNDGCVFACEAGTGVGKSFAYLLPAFAWTALNKRRIAIATATINLQSQLMNKDIPVIASLFKVPVKAVLVKGRGNYLCRARLLEALDEEGLFAGPDSPLRALEEWAKSTPSGDRADASPWPDDATWQRVRSESDGCMGIACSYRESCFVNKMKREAAEANLIVANHHILFADLAMRMNGRGEDETAVLPPVQAIVFDEAHVIESSATSFFSEELDRFVVFKQLSRLLRTRRDRKFGVAVALQNIKKTGPAVFAGLPGRMDAVREAMDALDAKAQLLFEGDFSIRIDKRTKDVSDFLLAPMKELEIALLALGDELRDSIEALPDEVLKEPPALEAKLILRNILSQATLAGAFGYFDEEKGSVYWIEKNRTAKRETFLRFYKTPLDISGLMDEAVFSRYRTVVCTSATLSVGESFDHWKKRTGLSRTEAVVEAVRYPSPFPYSTNAMLAIVEDAPFPDAPEYKPFVDRAVGDLCIASKGSALALFTSYEAMRSAYEAARPRLEALGITCFRQGDGDRSKLLADFKKDVASVLFATDSFWEGVDAPGETLRVVILCKLPFRVPTDPVQKARADRIEERGGNAFMELALPEAALRFKQGFGRLIRHSEDYGVVVVLDPRIFRKPYGKLFIDSLPETRRVLRPLDRACDALSRFLESRKEARLGGAAASD